MSHFNDPPPRMGATFSPGIDDYFLPVPPPDVVSPSPQRFTPEMPGQIQDSLANLELNGNRIQNPSPSPAPPAIHSPPATSNAHFSAQDRPPISRSFSPFPKPVNRTPNIPQSYEEHEATLEAARVHVLQSTDPEMQLAWAQDALNHVEICAEYERRSATFNDARPTTPPVERQLRDDALSIVAFLADQQHPRADFLKGTWLEFGKFGYPVDKPGAFRCYKRAAAKGYARAQYRMGLQYESTGESIKALQHYKTGEALGDAASCYRMGMMSLTGQLGQAQDYATAIRLIRQAADAADENAPQGAYVLGMLQARELSEIKVPEIILPYDLPLARTYIEKAAFLGFAKAQLKMGSAYEMCLLGCEFNPILSMHYNALAARQGEPEAEMAISKWYLCGHEGSFYKNEDLAYKYAQRAASSGLPTAQFAMGYFYEIGLTVQANITTATSWYEKAAANGNKDAQGRLDAIAKSKTLSKQDHENVALHRIKSQYGARQGGPPPRTAAMPPQPMPTIHDQAPYASRPPPQSPLPPAGRMTPYPVDDRPASVAPYPVDDDYNDPRRRPPPAGGFLAVDQRPYSTGGDGRYNQQPRPPNQGYLSPNPQGRPPPMPTARPMGNVSPGPQNMGPGPGYRPPPMQQGPAPGRPPPQGYRPPPQQQQNVGPPPPPASPKVDIGFSAPADARADQRNRPQMPPNSMSHRIDPRRPSPAPGQATRPSPSREDYTMSGGLSGKPPMPGSSAAAGKPAPSKQPVASSAASSKPSASKPSAAMAAAAAKPPQTRPGGAQTFEEMGVPSGKQDHDCAVM